MSRSDALRFGIVTGDALAADNLRLVCEALGRELGRSIVPYVFPTFAELREKLDSGGLEVAWSPPIPAVQLELAGKFAIAVGVFREGGSGYSSAIFTRAASMIRTLDDLRGKQVAWVDRESAAGYLLPKLKLASKGLRAGSYQEVFAGTHEAVVRAVLEGRADAGATNVSFAPVRGNIESAGWSTLALERDVRILATAGPIPPDVIVVSRELAEGVLEQITESLLVVASALATSEYVRALFRGHGFVMVGSYQYDGLRSLLKSSASAMTT